MLISHQKKTGNYTAQPTPRLLTFLYFLTKKYPAVSPINEYIKGGFNTSTSCRSSTIILPNNSVGSCKILSDDFDEFDNINDLESDFVHTRGCLM